MLRGRRGSKGLFVQVFSRGCKLVCGQVGGQSSGAEEEGGQGLMDSAAMGIRCKLVRPDWVLMLVLALHIHICLREAD